MTHFAREEKSLSAPVAKDKESAHLPRDEERRFGRNIAYGIQQTIACWATDFIDPFVSKWYQNRFGNKHHEVTNKHTFGGEVVGDTAAFGVYIAAKQVLGTPIDAVVDVVKNTSDGMLTKLGKKALKPWAQAAHISEDSPAYQKKLNAYKNQQAENMVDSAIIATSATGLNVGAQRYMFGNKQGLGVILASKIVGAFMTMGVMLGLRTGIPTTMDTLDNEIENRYVTPITKHAKRALGVRESVGERYDHLPRPTLQVSEIVPNALTPALVLP